jgi:dihydrofolate reductase
VKLIIIVAVNKNRVIGKNGKLPWHISDDLKRFKSLTSGHTVLMGRKTFESLSKPLPNRRNVVLSSQQIPGIETYPSIEQALEKLKSEEKVFVIGGGEIYKQLLHKADEIVLTIVEDEYEGDTFFPEYESLLQEKFELISREQNKGYVFENWRKRQ